MNNVILDMHDDVLAAVVKIENAAVGDVLLEIPVGSVIFDNILNLKLLEKEAHNNRRTVTFKTDDPFGKKLISMLEDTTDTAEGFVTREVTMSDISDNSISTKKKFVFKRPSFAVLKISMPKIRRLNLKVIIPVLLIAGALLAALNFLVWKTPHAQVTVMVNSQPLIKSVTVKSSTTLETNSTAKTLKGYTIQAAATEKKTIPTTGEKVVGEKAEGKITLINRTSNDISLDDGTTVTSDDLDFVLNDDATVPAQTLADPTDPLSVSVPGEAKVGVTATEIGDKYNLDKGDTFEVDDYKKSELSGVADSDFDGGSSKTVKVVAEEDLTALADDLSAQLVESSEKVLKAQDTFSRKLISGSVTTTVSSNEYSGKVGDELEELELNQTVSALGLAYSSEELNALLDQLVKDFVPNGFKLSDEEREVNVEVLGNSDSTVLTSDAADLQVTLKTFVVPDINEDKVISELAGKNLDEAQRILGSIRNVKTYELVISPNIPLLRKMPKNKENITMEIKLEE